MAPAGPARPERKPQREPGRKSAQQARLHNVALAALLLLWLALLAGFLGRYAWPLDLFAHFRVQYAVLFAVLALALAILGRSTLAACSLAGAVLSAIAVAPYVGLPAAPAQAGAEARAEAGARSFRLVSFNVWFRNRDYARVAGYLEGSAADAIVLQEVTKAQAAELRARLVSYPHSYIEPHHYGAAVFTRWPIVAAGTMRLAPAGGARVVRVVLQWRAAQVSVVGAHLHWPLGPRNSRWRNQELAGLAAFALTRSGPLLIAGDFNITPWSAHYQALLSRSGLRDCALGHGIAPSWPAQFAPLGIPIDHCLASRHWRSIDVNTGPYLGSDHRPLIADLSLR